MAPDAAVVHEPRASLGATWALWRRLGGGYEDLVARGGWPASLRRDPVLRRPLREVRRAAARATPVAPVPALAVAHAVARAAVLTGRLRARR
jgi:hypothetical protein